jgi:hypothetical protein
LSVTSDVVNFRDVEIAGAHQFADVAIMREKFLLLIQCTFTVVQQMSQIRHFGFERSGSLLIRGRLVFEQIQCVQQSLSFGLRSFQPLVQVSSLLKEILSAGLPILQFGLWLILGDLHPAHFGRLLPKLLPEVSDRLISPCHFRAQNLAFVFSIAALLFESRSILLVG